MWTCANIDPMTERLTDKLRGVLDPSICPDGIEARFSARIEEGRLTRGENNRSHFCVYFLPFNPETREIFIGHHKKANLWLSPGGHIEEGEFILDTLVREFGEELGVEISPDSLDTPFILTVTEIDNPPQVCREHYDIWYLVPTNGDGFSVDYREYHETRWVTLEEARELITDPNHVLALRLLEERLT